MRNWVKTGLIVMGGRRGGGLDRPMGLVDDCFNGEDECSDGDVNR